MITELLNEIERVIILREQYKSLQENTIEQIRINTRPAVFFMTQAIDSAKEAIAEQDMVTCIVTLRALKDFKE